MSRSGDSDDGNCNLWRGTVASTLRGRRTQRFLRELLDALDALPEKRLIADALADSDGGVCALGSVGRRRGLELERLDPGDHVHLAGEFGVAPTLVCVIGDVNDHHYRVFGETPEQRFERVRGWVVDHLREAAS